MLRVHIGEDDKWESEPLACERFLNPPNPRLRQRPMAVDSYIRRQYL